MNKMDVLRQEILHSQRILPRAEFIWGYETPAGRERAGRRANFLIKFGRIRKSKKVLELGCGTGFFTSRLQRTGAKIAAIDISPYFIKKVKESITAKNVTFYVGDVGYMNFKDNSYDCVAGNAILHHLTDLKFALQEIKRVLRKGGRFVFTEPNMLNPQIILTVKVGLIGKLLGALPSERPFSRWQIERLCREVGFSSVHVELFDFLHPWTPSFFVKPMRKIGLFLEKLPLVKEIAGSLIIYGKK